MDVSSLEDIGLTTNQSKVYLALTELGTTKAGPVVRASGLQNSAVHLALGQLVDLGLVSFIKKGKVKHYEPCDPRTFLRLMDEKHKRAETLVKELLAKKQEREQPEAEVFVGLNGLKAMCYQFIEDVQPGDEYLIFAFITKKQIHDDEVNYFYREFTEDRLRRGLEIKGIAHIDTKPYFVKNQRDISDILFVDFPVIKNASICNDKVIFTPWEETQTAFMITSSSLADNLREHFYSIWDNYKK